MTSLDAAHVVVGSGPSGVAAASALLDAGASVTLVDVGASLDPARASLVASLRALEPDAWPRGARASLALDARPPDGLPKLALGSSHPYALGDDAGLDQRGARCLVSHARGGFSTVWGAAVLPSCADDLRGWPVGLDALAPHYAAASRLLGVAGVEDALAARWPFYAPPRPPMPLGAQAASMLASMRRHEASLARRGVSFGRARLAVRAPGDGERACRLTGDCLGGCAYGAIWSAEDVLAELVARPRFRYVPGVRVRRVVPRGDHVEVQGRALDGGVCFRARRVFLAAGPLGTARVALDSLGRWGAPLSLRHQPYLLVPLLTAASSPRGERLHALAQLFLELDDPSLSARTVHAQVYTASPRLRAELRHALGAAGAVAPWLEGRLGALQVYLHDGDGAPMTLTATAAPEGARLAVEAAGRGRAPWVFARVVGRLAALSRALGAAPLVPMASHGAPGEGNHVGAVFPMRASPGRFEAGLLGELAGLPGVHLVDASSLPGLTASTFTLTVMAHAHRIAARVAALERAEVTPCGAR